MKRLALIFLLLLSSCFEQENSPEGVLKEFIITRMHNVVTRDYVLSKTTGKMRESLENLTEEEFIKFSDLKSFRKNSFKILSKSCQEKKCFVTYALSYAKADEKSTEYTAEVKKIAELQMEQGKWLIADVTNIKTYFESNIPVDVTQ